MRKEHENQLGMVMQLPPLFLYRTNGMKTLACTVLKS
jgi:hypothetical protein